MRPYLKINKRNKQKYFAGWEDQSAEKVLAARPDALNPTDPYGVRAVCKHGDIRVLMLKVKYGEEKTDPERARNLPRSAALQSAAETEHRPTVA